MSNQNQFNPFVQTEQFNPYLPEQYDPARQPQQVERRLNQLRGLMSAKKGRSINYNAK